MLTAPPEGPAVCGLSRDCAHLFWGGRVTPFLQRRKLGLRETKGLPRSCGHSAAVLALPRGPCSPSGCLFSGQHLLTGPGCGPLFKHPALGSGAQEVTGSHGEGHRAWEGLGEGTWPPWLLQVGLGSSPGVWCRVEDVSLGSQVWVTAGVSLRCWEAPSPGWGRVQWECVPGPLARGAGEIPWYWCCEKSRGGAPRLQRRFPTALQALLLLGAAALACLALDLLFLLFYSFWLCCRRRKSEEHLDADCCCTAWCVIIATLVCR